MSELRGKIRLKYSKMAASRHFFAHCINGGYCRGISLKREKCNLHLKTPILTSIARKFSPIAGIQLWPIRITLDNW